MGRDGSQKDMEETRLKNQTALLREEKEKVKLRKRNDNWQTEKKA